MKTKLLKKVRRRYGWYINYLGFPVLVDYTLANVRVYMERYEDAREGRSAEEFKKFCWEKMLVDMLGIQRARKRVFKIASNKSKQFHKHNNLKSGLSTFNPIAHEQSK
jgi:hypothetical protein